MSAMVNRGTVLVVDDDPIVLQVTREWLESINYLVFTREEALGTSRWSAKFQPDVILLDVNMPALAGTQLAQVLRKQDATKGAAIILYSSLEPAELRGVLAASGALGVIEKTGDARRFLGDFENLVGHGRAST